MWDIDNEIFPLDNLINFGQISSIPDAESFFKESICFVMSCSGLIT